MQRVMIGLLGLSFVVLLVLVTSIGIRPTQSVAPAGAQGETLATLGVAPGAEDVMLRRSARRLEDSKQQDKPAPTRI